MSATVKKERLPQLDLFRAFAILGVIHVHATSFAAGEDALASPYYYLFNWMNIFFKFGTPCFIFLSSFVLFYNYYNRSLNGGLISHFYKKRLLYIIVPYVIASVCYYTLVAVFKADRSLSLPDHLRLLGAQLATGTAYSHLYFVFINMQFYLLFPLFLLLFKRFPALMKWALPLGFLVQWGFVFWNKYVLLLPNKASYAPTYMSFYMLGAVLAVYFDPIKGWLTKKFKEQGKAGKWLVVALWASWLSVAFVHVQLYYNGRHLGQWANSLWYELAWSIHTLLSALVLLKAAFWLYHKASSGLLNVLSRIGMLSFAIYLLHPVFLLLYRRTGLSPGTESFPYVVWVWAGIPVCLFLAWGLASLVFRFVPGAGLLLGTKPGGFKAGAGKGIPDSRNKSAAG